MATLTNMYSGNFDNWLGQQDSNYQDNFQSDLGGNYISQYKALRDARDDWGKGWMDSTPEGQTWANWDQRNRSMSGGGDSGPTEGIPWEAGLVTPSDAWRNSLSDSQRSMWDTTSKQYYDMKSNTPLQRVISMGGQLAKGIPLAVAGAGLMGALGPSLSGMFGSGGSSAGGLSGLDAAMVDMGAGVSGGASGSASGAINPIYGASKMPYRPFDVLGVGQSMGGVAVPAVESSMSAAAAAGGSGISDFFKGITDSVKEKPMSSLIGGARTLSSLGGLWSSYQQNQDYGNLAGNLMSMYGDDSAYARQLRKELQRRDAASGRRSQYGPRSVELQAKLAELNSRNSGQLAQIYQQQGVNRDNMVKSGLNLAKGSGLMDWLDGKMSAPLAKLFGG